MSAATGSPKLVRPKPHISEARQLGVVFGAVEHELPPQRRSFAEERARVHVVAETVVAAELFGEEGGRGDSLHAAQGWQGCSSGGSSQLTAL